MLAVSDAVEKSVGLLPCVKEFGSFDVKRYGLAFLAEVVSAVVLAQGRGRRPSFVSTLVWCYEYGRRRHPHAEMEVNISSLTRRLFRLPEPQKERVHVIRERMNSVRGLPFHSSVRHTSTGCVQRLPHTLHDDGVCWPKHRRERLKKVGGKQFAEMREEEEVARCRPWRMSPGTRRMLEAHGGFSPGNKCTVDAKEGKKSLSTSLRNAATYHYTTKKSQHLTKNYPPFLERVKDDVAVRRERAAQREEYARTEFGTLQLTHQTINERVKRLYNSKASNLVCVGDGVLVLKPKVNKEVLSPPENPCGTVVAVPSTSHRKKEREKQRHVQCDENQKQLQVVPGEASALPSGTPQNFLERQRFWEARRVVHIHQLSDEVNAKRDEECIAACSFRPAINSPRFWRPQPEKKEPLVSSEFTPSMFIEYKSPTRSLLHHYSDINDLQIRRPSSVKGVASPKRVSRYGSIGSGKCKKSSSARGVSPTCSLEKGDSYTKLHRRASASAKVVAGRCMAYKASSSSSRSVSVRRSSVCTPRRVAQEAPLVKDNGGTLSSLCPCNTLCDLDEDTLVDLSLWWKNLVMQEFWVWLETEANENTYVCTDLYERILDTPFTLTLSFATVMQAMQELVLLSSNGPRAVVARQHLYSQVIPCRDGRVTFAQFIELYDGLCFTMGTS